MIRQIVRRPVASAVVATTGIAGFSVGSALALQWWAGLDPVGQLIAFGVGVIVAVGVLDRGVNRLIGLSPLAGIAWVGRGIMALGRTPEPTTGRDQFKTGSADWLRRALSRDREGSVPVDRVMRRDASTPEPVLDTATSVGFSGETGTGKSKSAKATLQKQGYGEPLLAHGLVQPPDEPADDPSIPRGTTEWFDFLSENEGLDVEKIGPENSSVRWNPYLDLREDLRDMTNLAEGLYFDPRSPETGWDEASRSMLRSALVLTDAERGDLAHLPDVMDDYGPEGIVDRVGQIPDLGPRAVSALENHDDLATVYQRVDNRLSNIMESDLFDESIDPISLREFFGGSGPDAITLENRTDARYAKSFWTFFVTQSVDISMNTPGKQQILLDEVDKLPKIPNLSDLASAGRSAGARGVIIVQSVSQMEMRYGENGARAIWGNCPNTYAFRPATAKSAEFALSSLGSYEMQSQSVSGTRHERHDKNISRSMKEKKPLTTGDLMSLNTGEALIQSKQDWWLADVTEPQL